MNSKRLSLVAMAAAVFATFGAMPAHAQKVMKYAHFQPGKNDQPKHVAALAFKEHVEKATNGSVKVEIYPAGQLGTAQQMMEGLRLGSVEVAVVHDGGIPGVYKTFNIFGLPYIFNDHAHLQALHVLGRLDRALGVGEVADAVVGIGHQLDAGLLAHVFGQFGKDLAEDMRK